MDAVVVIRKFDPRTDSAMVFTTWRNSAYYGASPDRREGGATWFRRKTNEITQILWDAKVRIACLSDAHDVIIGYSVTTGKHLNWVYVKPDYRERGIGSLLVPADVESYPEETTKIGRAILAAKKNKEN